MRKEIEKNMRKKLRVMIMVFAAVFAMAAVAHGADTKITARKEMSPSSGHTTQYFEVTGGYKGICSDPRNDTIGTKGMKVSIIKSKQ